MKGTKPKIEPGNPQDYINKNLLGFSECVEDVGYITQIIHPQYGSIPTFRIQILTIEQKDLQ
jgi:hypothetical protein